MGNVAHTLKELVSLQTSPIYGKMKQELNSEILVLWKWYMPCMHPGHSTKPGSVKMVHIMYAPWTFNQTWFCENGTCHVCTLDIQPNLVLWKWYMSYMHPGHSSNLDCSHQINEVSWKCVKVGYNVSFECDRIFEQSDRSF